MFKRIVISFLGWKLLLLIFALLATIFIKLNLNSWLGLEYARTSPYLLWIWANFDGVHYLDIARDGYSFPNFAYFPLLPFLISLINKILGIPILEAGLLAVNLAFFLSLFVFHKVVLLDFDQKITQRALILLLIFPVSFFFGAIYTESLFFLFATTSFYFARKSRWFWAGFFGLLATLTRLVGFTLLPALLWEWMAQNWRKKPTIKHFWQVFLKQRAFFIFLVPLGIIIYGLYLQVNWGSFLLFQKSMVHWNQSNFVFPLQVVFRYLKIFLLAPHNLAYFVAILEFISTLAYFLLAFYVYKRVRNSYGIWMFSSLSISTFTGTFQSMPRYILCLFPAFMALALLTRGPRWILGIVTGLFLLLGFIFVALFTRGYFVA